MAIAILALSIALILLSGQSSIGAAAPSSPHASSSSSSPTTTTPYWYNSTYDCSYYDWYYYYYYPYYYCNYYYYGYPYYYYYYGYPYYYSSYNYYSTASCYTLTVATDPSNLGTVTGGGTFTQGSSASFSVTQSTVQVSPNTRYVFSHWSGDYSGVGSSGTVTVNGAMKITAVYQLQYYLSVGVQPQSAPKPQGEGWYNAGDTGSLQNSGQTIGGDGGRRLVFQGWSVDGQGAQSGSSLSVAMNSPHSVTALYGQQYYLNVQTDQGVAYGSGWYDSGSTAQIYTSTPVSTTYGVSIVFNGWQGDIQSNSQSTSVLMDGPKNIIATWRSDPTVLYLTIGAVIVAALLIIGGIIAFAGRGRGGTQAPPPQPPAQQSASNTQPHDASGAIHRAEHHRKKPAAENTAESDSTT
jgi:hypothetical protein